jgi:4,5-dihydroxyphthalate decarboxylase
MAPKKRLTAAFWDYDRTRPLADGRVVLDGYDLDITFSKPEETFALAERATFDVSELSFSNSVTRLSQGELPYVLIPAFLSRAFRHSAIFVRRDRGIAEPADLHGKIVGVQEYDMTAAVVIRGFLRDQFHVLPEEIRWKIGETGGGTMPSFAGGQPRGLDISLLPPGKSLESRLIDGELDAIVALRPTATLTDGNGMVGRLFREPRIAEEEWFKASGCFPIMHFVGIRNDLVAVDPNLPHELETAFLRAKEIAVAELEIIQAPKVTLPWPHAALSETRKLMGDDYWPYGLAPNRATIEKQLEWSWLDGLQRDRITPEALFRKR